MGGGLTIMLLGGFMFIMFRRDFHHDLKGEDAGAEKSRIGKKVNG
jgi:hypothetical protein